MVGRLRGYRSIMTSTGRPSHLLRGFEQRERRRRAIQSSFNHEQRTRDVAR